MKIKALTSFYESGLDNKVNSFLARPDINVLSIQFAATFFYLGAMITYEDKKSQDIREEKA